jgi:hypothetical protein
MSDRAWRRCGCPQCTIRSLMGPAVVITIGVLFLLHEMRDGSFGFGETWPFILIVAGVIHLASSLAPSTGHIEDIAPPPAPGGPPAPGSTQAPMSGQGR